MISFPVVSETVQGRPIGHGGGDGNLVARTRLTPFLLVVWCWRVSFMVCVGGFLCTTFYLRWRTILQLIYMYSPSAGCYKMQCSIGSQCISTGHSNVEEVTKPIQMEEMAGMALEEETYTHRYRGRY